MFTAIKRYEFRLVREALIEREVLLKAAPHIIRPLRFVLPHHRGLRPWPILRLGLFLYDHLGGRKILPPTKSLDLTRDPAGTPLKPEFTRAFEYSDCWVDDARLVVLNACDAAERGAVIRPRTRVVDVSHTKDRWELQVEAHGGRREMVAARILVNATGPWVSEVATNVIRTKAAVPVRLVQGSHIVTPRLFAHDKCYIFQNSDGLATTTPPSRSGRSRHATPSPMSISEAAPFFLMTRSRSLSDLRIKTPGCCETSR